MTKKLPPHSTASHDLTHHHGFAKDLARFQALALKRRDALRWAAGTSVGVLVGCSGDLQNRDGSESAAGGSNVGGADASSGDLDGLNAGDSGLESCTKIPEETAGPFPGDGTNGPNALALSGVVRRDIRASIGGASGVAEGVELHVTLTVVSAANPCTPLGGYAVYLWHCDKNGDYSMYGNLPLENYLRGVQETDAQGNVTFITVFPGCYTGRWPHMHFEVFPSAAAAVNSGPSAAVSQLAFSKDACNAVYATAGYESSGPRLAAISLATDGIFRDGAALQLAAVTGSVAVGLRATLTVAV